MNGSTGVSLAQTGELTVVEGNSAQYAQRVREHILLRRQGHINDPTHCIVTTEKIIMKYETSLLHMDMIFNFPLIYNTNTDIHCVCI